MTIIPLKILSMTPQLAAGLGPLSGELDPQKEEVLFMKVEKYLPNCRRRIISFNISSTFLNGKIFLFITRRQVFSFLD
jgi:hypothetical protein